MCKKINNKVTKTITAALALLMLVSLSLSVLSPTATANTQAEIDRLREVKRDLDRQRQAVQERINDYEFERLTYIAQKEVLDDRIRLTALEIDSVNEVIDLYSILIAEKELEVRDAQTREQEQLDDYKARVRSMEENGMISYLEILFDSTSIMDLLARWDFISEVMNADERAFRNLTAAREETQAAEDALRATKSELEDEKLQLEIIEQELEIQINEANILIQQIMDTIDGEKALYEQVTQESSNVQAEINRLVEQQRREEEERRRREAERRAREAAERRAREEAAGNTVTGTGQLVWPAHGPVTSGFGDRIHPVFGGTRFHEGIDIGVSFGTSVVAADSGTVIVSTFSSTYGNYIVINHGNGMTTLYAHLSSRSVGAGTSVTRGQQIGLVGSTGVSTGPHLHFEVSVDGSRVNPLRYL